jgi:signal-transduction protein with cAMP-binding, CBS, and nucleotidyltransferase domain
MNEALEDELRIMEERARRGERPMAWAFDQPVRRLCRYPAKTLPLLANVADAIAIMQSSSVGAVVVVNDNARLVGIVTERDLLRKVLGRGEHAERRPVTEIMTSDPETLQLDDQIAFVMHTMHVGGFRHVPIVDEDDIPLHVISIRDVLAFVLDQFPRRVLNMPPRPFRGDTERYGG